MKNLTHLNPNYKRGIDFFANSIAEVYSKQNFIIETHSEYLLLKFKSTGKKWTIKTRRYHYKLCFQSENGSEIQHIEFDEQGLFTSKWPDNLLDYSYDFTTE